MKDILVIALAIMGVLARLSESTAAEPLTVIDFSQPPNYALCTDIDDIRQLTDGKLATFPIWMNKLAVGWAAFTPIAIQLRVADGSSARSPQAGTLRVHSAKGLSAGVDVPRHVDVYTRDSSGNLRLVGSLTPESGKLTDKSVHWLDIDIRAATDTLVVVLHASGDYLFLDEVVWQPSGVGQMPHSAAVVTTIRNALEDSTRRTREALQNTAEAESQNTVLQLESGAMHAWIQDPWAPISPGLARVQIQEKQSAVDMRGYAGEHESACIGIAMGEAAATGGLRVTVSGLPAGSAELFEVRPVMAANGQRVYDPLVPINDNATFTARPGVPFYIWLDVNLRALGPGTYRFEIRLDGSNRMISIPGKATVSAYTGNGVKPLRAVNWAYLSDMPIFRNQDAAVRNLVAHGINVFVAHPAEIPGLALDGSWAVSQATQFARTVDLAKDHGMLLLYLGWNAERNPLGFSNKQPTLDPAAKDRLRTWIGRMSAYLAAQGLPPDRWALYPVDEPNRSGLQLIKVVAEAVKQWNPSIRFYADPSVHAKPSLEISHLQDLQTLVDYWQPNILAIRGNLGEFFKGLKKEWWIYGNPKSPAKLGSPLHDYRLQAWWAWQYGASGVGFWSYSDTNGSSAWDDLDSRRPDWAVVYESPDGIVSSRRWEAFREGLEDYALLAARKDVQESIRRIGKQNFDQWETADIESVRHVLLSDLFLPTATNSNK
jgi:hypothetical protein